MDWRLMVARQAVLARLPFGTTLRRLKRTMAGYPADFGKIESTLLQYEQMRGILRKLGRPIEGASVLEIGSGWFPTVPIMLAIDGARDVLMSDLTPHMDERTIDETLRYLRRAFPDNQSLVKLQQVSDLPIRYSAPFDPRTIPDGSLDLVISRTVLEHVPRQDIGRLLGSLRLKLAPGGLMFHLIDHSDHLEHSDKSISKINFLTWTERQHRVVNWLSKGGENRLRYHEFPAIFEDAGYRVVDSSGEIHVPTREIAETLPLAQPYSAMSADQVAVLTSIYVLAPKP